MKAILHFYIERESVVNNDKLTIRDRTKLQ